MLYMAYTLEMEYPISLQLVKAEVRRRRAIRRMRRLREQLQEDDRAEFSQQAVAKKMGWTKGQPALARLETGMTDPRISTLERYAAALGYFLEIGLVNLKGERVTKPGSVPWQLSEGWLESAADFGAQQIVWKEGEQG